MDLKDLTKQIVSLIFPLLKLDTVKQIGEEFIKPADDIIQKIWKKVKPVFIEEIEIEEKPEEAQIAIRTSLRKMLKEDEELKQELIKLFKVAEKKQLIPEKNTTIKDSKNVIQGSNIEVGGNFHLGDKAGNSVKMKNVKDSVINNIQELNGDLVNPNPFSKTNSDEA